MLKKLLCALGWAKTPQKTSVPKAPNFPGHLDAHGLHGGVPVYRPIFCSRSDYLADKMARMDKKNK